MTGEVSIHLPNGDRAQIVETDGDKTTIRSPNPSPPGSTVTGSIEGVSCPLQLKVRNCNKVGDSFVIDGRLQNATRELKRHLLPKP